MLVLPKGACPLVARWWTWMSRPSGNKLPIMDGPVMGAARGLAAREGVRLRSQVPKLGWVTRGHSRDGKFYPCSQNTKGATPAWIWYGDK